MIEHAMRYDDGRLLDELTSIVSRAAAAILAARKGALDAHLKPDQSPVTAADVAAEGVILEGLRALVPGLPIVSEEAQGRTPSARLADSFAVVDPLDGTRELIAGRDEFTINLAIVTGGRPRVGIVAAPALGLIWRGRDGGGAERLRLAPGAPASAAQERTAIHTRACPATGLVAVVSRSHLDARTTAFLSRLPQVERIPKGSAMKFCLIAEGSADLYPRFGPTSEWDVAAGHAVLAAAGGTVVTPEGGDLPYGRVHERFLVGGFIAWGDPAAPRRLGV
jgi:3'(2'), 5'-bisphosphate nucleotidase